MPPLTTSQKVAIAVSVPLAAVILYMLLKWARDDEEFEEIEEEGQEFVSSSDLVLEVKVPQSLAGAVIGRGGSTVKQIQKESQTRINFKDDNGESDGEEEEKQPTRTILIKGSRERTKQAEVLIRRVLAEQPAIEKRTINIPQRVVGRVIGKGGKTIRQLCRISGAKIVIDRDNEVGELRTCEVTGTETQIECAKQLIEEKIGEDQALRAKQKNESHDNAKDKLTFVQLPTDGEFFGVYVSAMDTPGHFWIQKVTEDSKKLDNLVEEMTVFYGDKKEGCTLNTAKIGDLCCSPFQHDKSWYRGEIIDVISSTEVMIHYLDFGDTGKVSSSNVKALREEFCELAFQAVECYLANIKPKDGKWSPEACGQFEKLSCCAQWKVLMARVVSYDNGVPLIELFDTNGEQDVNIEHEMVNRGYAVYNEELPSKEPKDVSKNPHTEETVPQSQVIREPVLQEKAVNVEEMNEQFESFDFDQQSLEMDDSLNFEFVSPQGGTQEIGMPNPTEIIPVNLREPVDEPTLSAVEHTVVSCADVSQLSTVLDCGHTEETLKDVGEDDIPILSSTTDDLRETPKEQLSYVAGDLPLEQNTLEAPEPTDRDSLSGNSNAAEVTSLLLHEENSEDQEVSDNGELESASFPQEVHFEGVAESPDSRSKTGSEAVVKNSISDSDLNQERGEAIDILDKNIHSTEVLVRRSISDDVIADDTLTSGGNSEPKLTRSSSEVVVSPRKSKEVDEMDARAELSSKSLGSLGNLSKGGKRLLAANFNQLPSCSKRSIEKEEEDEDDDDSLYLSAREDSDSTGFLSAIGSRTNLKTDSDVTPSGYLSDSDGDWNESYRGNKTREETRLDGTLLAERLGQYADK